MYSQDPKRKIQTHHFASRLTEEVVQCIVFDSPEANARIIGRRDNGTVLCHTTLYCTVLCFSEVCLTSELLWLRWQFLVSSVLRFSTEATVPCYSTPGSHKRDQYKTEQYCSLLWFPGVEYIISDNLFSLLPEEEKKLWHSHAYEVHQQQAALVPYLSTANPWLQVPEDWYCNHRVASKSSQRGSLPSQQGQRRSVVLCENMPPGPRHVLYEKGVHDKGVLSCLWGVSLYACA